MSTRSTSDHEVTELMARYEKPEDDELRAWLSAWRADGGDARRFRRGIRARFGDDELAAWRYCEQALIPLRLRIRQLARALLVHPRHLRCANGLEPLRQTHMGS